MGHPAQAQPHEAQFPPQEDRPAFLSRIIPLTIRKTVSATARIKMILIRLLFIHASIPAPPFVPPAVPEVGDPSGTAV